jgi:hypothetical protein
MSTLKHRFTTAALIALGAFLLLPAAGQAAQIFGSRLINEPTTDDCKTVGPPCTVVSFIHPVDPNGDPYSGGAPSNGVITKFRIRAKAETATQVTFRVANINRPNPADATMATASAAGTGPTVTIPATPEGADVPILEFPGRLPVKQGQHLALDQTTALTTYDSSGSKFSYVFSPLLGGAPQGSAEATGELLVQATLEPDADGDGFGDETQDQCPSQATTQGPCDLTPPKVNGLRFSSGKISYSLSEAATVRFTLEKKTAGRKVGGKCVAQTAKNRKHTHCAKFKAVGNDFGGPGNAGADTAGLPPGRKLGPGTYRLTVKATDVAGNVSTSSMTFKVKQKHRR